MARLEGQFDGSWSGGHQSFEGVKRWVDIVGVPGKAPINSHRTKSFLFHPPGFMLAPIARQAFKEKHTITIKQSKDGSKDTPTLHVTLQTGDNSPIDTIVWKYGEECVNPPRYAGEDERAEKLTHATAEKLVIEWKLKDVKYKQELFFAEEHKETILVDQMHVTQGNKHALVVWHCRKVQ